MSTPNSDQTRIDDLIATKWGVPILRTLLAGPARFSHLRGDIPGVSANILAARLRLFERAGVVERAQLPEPADCQVYRLTKRGAAVRSIVEAIDEFSVAWESDRAAS